MSEDRTYTRFEFLKLMGIGAGAAGLASVGLLGASSPEISNNITVQEYLDFLFTPDNGSIREYRTVSQNLANMPPGLPNGISAISIKWFPGLKDGVPVEGLEVQFAERQKNIFSLSGSSGPINPTGVLTDKFRTKQIKFEKYRNPSFRLNVNFSPRKLSSDISDEDGKIIIPENVSYTSEASVVLNPSAGGGANKVTTSTAYFLLNESPQNWQIQRRKIFEPNGLEMNIIHSASQFFVNGKPTEISDSFMQETLDTLIPLNSPSN